MNGGIYCGCPGSSIETGSPCFVVVFLLALGRLILPALLWPVTLDVVVRGHRGNNRKAASPSCWVRRKTICGASVVILDRPLDFNLPAFELANVSHSLEVAGQHDHGEGTDLGILAEIEQRNPVAAIFHVLYGSPDALHPADVLARFGE